MRVELLTDWPERLVPGAELWVEGRAASLRLAAVEVGGRVPVFHFEGVESREGAETLTGVFLEAPARDLEAGSYFWDELVGLRVEGPGGEIVGELVEVFRAGGNEVYRVMGPAGERLVPALRSAIDRIDLAAGVMVLTDDEPEEVR